MRSTNLSVFLVLLALWAMPFSVHADETIDSHARAQAALREWRERQGLSPVGADKLLGFLRDTVEAIEGGTAVPTAGQATIMESSAGIPSGWWAAALDGVEGMPDSDVEKTPDTSDSERPEEPTDPADTAIAYYLFKCVAGDRATAAVDARWEWDELIDEGREPEDIVAMAKAIPSACSFTSFRIAVLASRDSERTIDPYAVPAGTRVLTTYNPLARKGKTGLMIDRVGFRSAGGVFLGCSIGAFLTAGVMAGVFQQLEEANRYSTYWDFGKGALVVSLAVAGIVCLPIGIVSLARADAVEHEIEQRQRNGRWIMQRISASIGPSGVVVRF
jgi:hypothetical protein